MTSLAPARQQWWFRTLLVIGVLAGVMGMHGLTAGHAAMRMTADAVTTGSVMASDRPMTSDTPTSSDSSTSALWVIEGEVPAGHTRRMQACVAILAAAVALLVLLLRRGRHGRPLLRSAPRVMLGTAPLAIRPRVLALSLHQLSICRT